MNTRQRSNIISKLSEIINDGRIKLLEKILDQRTHYLTVVLDDLLHPQNASAIIRSSECIGIQDLHIIEDKNEHKTNRDVVKGSAKWISLQRYNEKNGRHECLEKLKQQDYKIVAMALDDDCIPLEALPVDKKLALCFGCEETGLSKEVKDQTDYNVKIPIAGFTESYNVSVSAGISLYYLFNKIKDSKQNWRLGEDERENLLIDWLSKSTPTGRSLLSKYRKESE